MSTLDTTGVVEDREANETGPLIAQGFEFYSPEGVGTEM